MALKIKVEVIHRQTIIPCSPTPHHLRTSNLSVFDQLSPDVYVPLLLFYPNNKSDDNEVNYIYHHSLVAERTKILKTSLSKTLTHFYPFAGKFHYNDSICCNDHGTLFLEAQVNCPISKILDKPDFGMLKKLLPVNMGGRKVDASALVQVQSNFFECGGMAIGVCISHKVADASTINKFLCTWAAISLGLASSTDHVVLPATDFGAAASLFPPLGLFNSPLPAVEFSKENWITRRVVFDAPKISALKSKAASVTVTNPSRVEVVSALIWKCATEASRSKLGSKRPSEWLQCVNMRKILVQRSVESFMGNFFGFSASKTTESEALDEFQSMVSKLRKGIKEFKVKYANDINADDACQISIEYQNLMDRDDVDAYSCSSWCRFSFYTLDFGWGKPSWVNVGMEFTNLIVLVDTRDGDGIEAFLTFNEEDMAIFESNQELLAYAALNPTVLI